MSSDYTIPEEVFKDVRLSDGARLLYAVILRLHEEHGRCVETDDGLALLRGVGLRSAQRSLSALIDTGLVERSRESGRRVLIPKREHVKNGGKPCQIWRGNPPYLTYSDKNGGETRQNWRGQNDTPSTCITVDFRSLDPRSDLDPVDQDLTVLKEDRGNRGSLRGEEGKGTHFKVNKRVVDTPEFQEFWLAYPRKVCKSEARKAWSRLAPDEKMVAQIMAGLERHKKREWQGREERLIPHATTWLNQRRFEDDGDEKDGNKGCAGNDSSPAKQTDYTGGKVVPHGAERIAGRGGAIDWADVPDFL